VPHFGGAARITLHFFMAEDKRLPQILVKGGVSDNLRVSSVSLTLGNLTIHGQIEKNKF
jgi:hypothetical protein